MSPALLRTTPPLAIIERIPGPEIWKRLRDTSKVFTSRQNTETEAWEASGLES